MRGVVCVPGAGITFALHVGDVVDLVKVRERMRRDLAKAEAEWARISDKLDNPRFLEMASAGVVNEHCERELALWHKRRRARRAYAMVEYA